MFVYDNEWDFNPSKNELDLDFALELLRNAPTDEAIRFAGYLKTHHPDMWNEFITAMESFICRDDE